MDEQLINNIVEKNVGHTSYGNHTYSDLWYVCNTNKICITFTPRGACSIVFQQFLDINNLLGEALKYNRFIHFYRELFNKYSKIENINTLIDKQYTFIKFIMNPYIRAVSIYRVQESSNLSFREYLKEFKNLKLNNNDEFHNKTQYIEGEESVITKYIKIDKNEKFDIKLFDGSSYTLDVNRYTSDHHGLKNINNTEFCGDVPRHLINENLPKTYRYFYDEEIKSMVETFYGIDIQKYGYSFDDF